MTTHGLGWVEVTQLINQVFMVKKELPVQNLYLIQDMVLLDGMIVLNMNYGCLAGEVISVCTCIAFFDRNTTNI